MSDEQQTEANRRLEAALESSDARDPREFYRGQLKELRDHSRPAYDEAVHYYRDVLIPSIADGSAEPLGAWTEYGRTLAELRADGRTMALDPTGRAEVYAHPVDATHLVLHLPNDKGSSALLVALPRELTRAQRAAYDWLVQGRQTLRPSNA